MAATDCRQYCPRGYERRCKNNRCVCESKSCTTHLECVDHQCMSGFTPACASNTHQCVCNRICHGNNDCARTRCSNGDPMCTPAQVNTRICSCETTCSNHADCSNHHCARGYHTVCDSGSCGCGHDCSIDSDCSRYHRCPAGKSPFCMAVSSRHACLCLGKIYPGMDMRTVRGRLVLIKKIFISFIVLIFTSIYSYKKVEVN